MSVITRGYSFHETTVDEIVIIMQYIYPCVVSISLDQYDVQFLKFL